MSIDLLDKYYKIIEKYVPYIGLEIHIGLNTNSKLFCACRVNIDNVGENQNICPVCIGMPGTLPVVNISAVDYTILIGLYLNCSINSSLIFDRKHYFYPDLPKGYQISQNNNPIAFNGTYNNIIPIQRVHLEEDAGKIKHISSSGRIVDKSEYVLIDYNRAGRPLAEIVTGKIEIVDGFDFVITFVKDMVSTFRRLNITNGRMEHGEVRFDVNISIKSKTSDITSKRVEVKNINSLNSLKNSILFEVVRQGTLLESNEMNIQETRNFDDKRLITISSRSKEDIIDYRYLQEPDIPESCIPESRIKELHEELLSKLDNKEKDIVINQWKLTEGEYNIILKFNCFNHIYETIKLGCSPSIAYKWWCNYIVSMIDNIQLDKIYIKPDDVFKLIQYIENNNHSLNIIKLIILNVENKKMNIDDAIESVVKNIKSDDSLIGIVDEVLLNNVDLVNKFKEGKESIINVLMGIVMRKVKGQASASTVKNMLLKRIS